MRKSKRRRHPGVAPLGQGKYRIRAEVRHPKTGRVHEIDRVVEAESDREAASLRATARSEWLARRTRAVGDDKPRRLRDALTTWLDAKAVTIAPSTMSTYRSAVGWWS